MSPIPNYRVIWTEEQRGYYQAVHLPCNRLLHNGWYFTLRLPKVFIRAVTGHRCS